MPSCEGVRHQHGVSLPLTLTVWLKSCLSGFRAAESPPSPHFAWSPLQRGVKDEAWGVCAWGSLCRGFVRSHRLCL